MINKSTTSILALLLVSIIVCNNTPSFRYKHVKKFNFFCNSLLPTLEPEVYEKLENGSYEEKVLNIRALNKTIIAHIYDVKNSIAALNFFLDLSDLKRKYEPCLKTTLKRLHDLSNIITEYRHKIDLEQNKLH